MQKIMFSDEYGLTSAVLKGKKILTRRICKHQRPIGNWEMGLPIIENKDCDDEGYCTSSLNFAFGWYNPTTEEKTDWNIPKYKIGEVVAVAQSYSTAFNEMMQKDSDYDLYEKFRDYSAHDSKGWSNKMFVRAELMPHQIQITNIRLGCLQIISNEDCINEGIEIDISPFDYGFWDKNKIRRSFSTPREAYASLIDKISGKGTWESNPYVFVYEFKLIK